MLIIRRDSLQNVFLRENIKIFPLIKRNASVAFFEVKTLSVIFGGKLPEVLLKRNVAAVLFQRNATSVLSGEKF